MALNIALMFLVIGWTINASVIQAKDGLTFWMWANGVLANVAGLWLVVRLS